MIVRLKPEYKFVCDRCGKEEFPNENNEFRIFPTVTFQKRTSIVQMPCKREAQVCDNCLAEFWEFAENFFDEVNKEGNEK